MKKYFSKEILLILALGFLSLTWFRGNNLISGGDFGLPLDRLKYFRLMFFSWDETYSMGAPNPRQVASLVPYALWGAITEILGLSLVFWEKSLFYIWFAGSGLSMYYLGRVLGMAKLGRLAAAIFYMFNPFSLIIIWLVSHGLYQMSYAFAPLVFGLYLNGLKNKKSLKYIITASFVWLLITGSSYVNPRMVIIHWLPLFFYFVWALAFQKNQRGFILKYSFSFLICWLFFNSFWILPFISTLGEAFASAHSPFLMPDIDQLKLTSVKLLDALRMSGYWSLKSGYKGEPYYPYWQYYNLTLIKITSWLIPTLVVLGFFNKKLKKNPLKYFFLASIIFGLLGISGAHPPLGKFIIWFYRLLPPLATLARFNFLLFGMPTFLIFTVLVGFGFLTIDDFGFKKIGKLIFAPLLVLAVLLNIVLVFPFWNGEVVRAERKLFPGERFQVPQYWWQAKEWLAKQEDFFRILPLPMSRTYNVAFDWGQGYSGGDPGRWFTAQPILNANTGDTFKVAELVGESIEKETNYQDLAKLLGFLNVRYLLVRNDTRWEFLKGHSWWFHHQPENIADFIEKQSVLKLEKQIGLLDFYRLDDQYLLPHIYAPAKVTMIDGQAEALIDLAQFLQPEKKEAILLATDSGLEQDFIWRRPSIPQVEGKNDLTRVIYEVQVAKEGRYEMLLPDDGFLRFYQSEKAKVVIDQKEVEERTFVFKKDNLVSLGEVALGQGKHLLTIFPPPTINLIDKPFFATSLTSIPLIDFRPGESYGLSFAAKHLQGQKALLLIWENYLDLTEPIFKDPYAPFGYPKLETAFTKIEIPPTPSWQDFEIIFDTHLYARQTGLSFLVIEGAESLFDAVKVQRVFNNPLILKPLVERNQVQTPPQISFKKLSPVKYEVAVKGAIKPFWLVFSEAFHPDWKTSVEAEHLMMNGFVNGWYLEKTGDYKLDIYFTPQKIFNVGVGVSGLTMFVCLGYLGFSVLSSRNKKER